MNQPVNQSAVYQRFNQFNSREQNGLSNETAPSLAHAGDRPSLLTAMLSLGLGFAGFNLFLLFLASFGLRFASQTYTIPYRGFFLFISVCLIGYLFYKQRLINIGWLWIPLLTFWGLYGLRIVLDGYLQPIYLDTPPIIYLQRAFGAAFIPMFIFMRPFTDKESRYSFFAFWCLHLTSLALSFILYRDIIGMSYRYAYGYGHHEVGEGVLLGPIGLSYIGVMAIGVALQRICMDSDNPARKRFFNLFYLAIIGAGMIILLLGETRSAVVSCVSVALIVVAASTYSRSLGFKLKTLFIILLAGAIMFLTMLTFGEQTIARFRIFYYEIERADMSAGGGRWSLYQNAVRQFMEKPILGSALEEQYTNTYPHNHFIEAFMATGIAGGISFAVLAATALYSAFKILKENKRKGWIACFFLVMFFRGMFSGSIIFDQLWYGIIAVIAVYHLQKQEGINNKMPPPVMPRQNNNMFDHHRYNPFSG